MNDKNKIDFIMKLYENNPRFVSEMIDEYIGKRDFSDYSVEESLYVLEKEKVDDIYERLKFLEKVENEV